MAMYLAYIQRNCPTARNIVELSSNELLPLQHTDNPTTVDSFIHYLGIEYFNTNNSGTLEFNIRPGINKYLYNQGFVTYAVEKRHTDYYNTFMRVINEAANPIIIDIPGHTEPAIGFRRMPISGGVKEMVIVNPGYPDSMSTFEIDYSMIENYYIIRRA